MLDYVRSPNSGYVIVSEICFLEKLDVGRFAAAHGTNFGDFPSILHQYFVQWAPWCELLPLGKNICVAESALPSASPLLGDPEYVESLRFAMNQTAIAFDSHFGQVSRAAVPPLAGSKCGHGALGPL